MNAFEDNPIRILCSSLTPTTLAAVIADLEANDQTTDAEQRIADSIRANVLDQLAAMVGADEARRLIDAFLR